jgi:hypothetical protein
MPEDAAAVDCQSPAADFASFPKLQRVPTLQDVSGPELQGKGGIDGACAAHVIERFNNFI